jgi:DNA-binding transcriptional LysR family regulator
VALFRTDTGSFDDPLEPRSLAPVECSEFFRRPSAGSLPAPQFALVSDFGVLNRRMVASLDLLGLAPRMSVEPVADDLGLKILTITDAKWLRPVALMYRQGGYLSPLGRRFIDILKEHGEANRR